MKPVRRHALVLAVAALALPSPPALSQSLPEGWNAVADSGDPARVTLLSMPPGWHLSPGAAGLIYRSGDAAEPPFRVEYEAYRFPGETSGYGVFVGGRGLEPAGYDFFEILLDAAGRYRLGHRAGPEFHEIVPWTAHPAIAVPTAESNGHNVLVVEAWPDRFVVTVNGTELTAFEPPAYARFDGVVGLRVLDAVNVHVTRLDVVPLEADPEARPGR